MMKTYKKDAVTLQVAAIYSKLIEPINGEDYRETAKRLSEAIGDRIPSKVFHLAVKMVRKEVKNDNA